MYEVRDSAAIFLRRAGTRLFLFHLRDDIPSIPDAGLWSLFGGSIEDGETPENAIIREVAEETGINLQELKCLGTIDAYDIIGSSKLPLKITMFLSDIEESEKDIILNEGQMARFFSLDGILAQELKPEFRHFIIERRDEIEQ
jgi:8-oxo-dGTP pyrophosphatase MutT (NUDIX family)